MHTLGLGLDLGNTGSLDQRERKRANTQVTKLQKKKRTAYTVRSESHCAPAILKQFF